MIVLCILDLYKYWSLSRFALFCTVFVNWTLPRKVLCHNISMMTVHEYGFSGIRTGLMQTDVCLCVRESLFCSSGSVE